MPKQNQENAELGVVRRRVAYRAWHRGTKELDFMLGNYCDAHVAGFGAEQLALFEEMMEFEETELQQWLMGQCELPQNSIGKLLADIRGFSLEGKLEQ